jgi:hypothetical protein
MLSRSRRAIERLYRDKATISTVEAYKDGSITKERPVVVAEVPCKISLGHERPTIQGDYALIEYDAKLYLSPDINVPDGAGISVLDVNGRVTNYVGSRSFAYPNHQEIFLQYADKVR